MNNINFCKLEFGITYKFIYIYIYISIIDPN